MVYPPADGHPSQYRCRVTSLIETNKSESESEFETCATSKLSRHLHRHTQRIDCSTWTTKAVGKNNGTRTRLDGQSQLGLVAVLYVGRFRSSEKRQYVRTQTDRPRQNALRFISWRHRVTGCRVIIAISSPAAPGRSVGLFMQSIMNVVKTAFLFISLPRPLLDFFPPPPRSSAIMLTSVGRER